MSWMRRTGAGAAALAVGLWFAPAAAQPSADDQARIHFQAGTNYFQIADYESALREYTRAHDLTGRVPLLYNIYLCHERLGDVAHAVEALERYLAQSPEDLAERATLQQRLETMRRRLAEQRGETGADTGTDPGVETDAANATEPGAAPETSSGGGPEGGAGSPSGQRRDVSAEGDVAGGSGMPVVSVVSFVVAGGFLATSLVFGGLALSEDSDLEGRCAGACRDEELDALRTYMTIADLGLGIALVAGGVGLVVALLSGSDQVESERAVLSPWLSPGAGGASARVTF